MPTQSPIAPLAAIPETQPGGEPPRGGSVRVEGPSRKQDGFAPRRGKGRPPRIAIFGAFGSGNLGNECTLYALLQNLRQALPSSSFCCVCSGPKEAASSYGIPALPIRYGRLPGGRSRLLRAAAKLVLAFPVECYRWYRVFRAVRGKDLLIMTGTGMLSDVGIVPMGLHYDILRWSLAARLSGCKLLYVSVGVGPIRHPLSRWFVKVSLSLATFRSYRDDFSRDYAQAMRVRRDQGNVYPDLAFSLPRSLLSGGSGDLHSGKVIGLGVITNSRRRATASNDDTLYQEYMGKLATLAAWLLQQNYTVRLLIGDVVYDGRARRDLLATLERMGVTYPPSQLQDEPARSFEELLGQLASTDVVIASRFHNVLLSLAVNKPVIAISFHEKVDALMKAAGLEAYCQDIENIDVNRLVGQLAAVEANAQDLKQQIGRAATAWRLALEEQYQAIVRFAEEPDLVVS
ncbi:MAG: polysaccharide pyruvyl transferase family protein [Acidobacteriaceae bacterium]